MNEKHEDDNHQKPMNEKHEDDNHQKPMNEIKKPVILEGRTKQWVSVSVYTHTIPTIHHAQHTLCNTHTHLALKPVRRLEERNHAVYRCQLINVRAHTDAQAMVDGEQVVHDLCVNARG